MNNLPNVKIYVHGACTRKQGCEVGTYAARLTYKDKVKEISGKDASPNNNRMQIQAAVKAVEALKVPCNITLLSTSGYLCKTAKNLKEYRDKGYRLANGQEMANQDQWASLVAALSAKHHTLVARYPKLGTDEEIAGKEITELANSLRY